MSIAVMTGGFGGEGVRRFYSEHFINQIPKDAKVTPISRTIGKDQVVDEFIVSFTRNTQWDYLLPGIPPTGKKVDFAARTGGTVGRSEPACRGCRASQKAAARR